jgi:hypothetical protein
LAGNPARAHAAMTDLLELALSDTTTPPARKKRKNDAAD